MKPDPSIELDNLRKVYPRKIGEQLASVAMAALGRPSESAGSGIALEGLTLSIHKGDRLGIIGPNGAGKSTLLQMLAGITEPTSGRMIIAGKVTAILTIGSGLREDLTGRENIYLDGATIGKTRKAVDAEVEAIIEFAELGKFIDLPLRTYSTGMKARLAFAMLTQLNPEILIIDEALSVGDAAFSLKASKKISQLCDRGAIVLIVSHSMASVRELCNRCLWLNQGRLIMDGSPEEVTRAYLETVNEANEANHLARFNSLEGTKSLMTGFTISELRCVSMDGDVKLIVSGAPLSIYCNWRKPDAEPLGRFILRCIRLDGALICQNSIILSKTVKEQKLCMKYSKLNLAPGLYRMHLEWQDMEGGVRAESATVLEVISEDRPSGGRPVLLSVGAVKVSKICEDVECQ